jgi:hypothetical protein
LTNSTPCVIIKIQKRDTEENKMFKFFKKVATNKNSIGQDYSCEWWMNQANYAHIKDGIQMTCAFLKRLERQGLVEQVKYGIDPKREIYGAIFIPADGVRKEDVRMELVKAFKERENRG